MRSILAGLVLILLPGLASAECQCACVRGKATAICRPQALVEPICQQVCIDKIEQSLGTPGMGGVGGGIGGGSLGPGSSIGANVGAATGIDAGIGISDTVPPVGIDTSSGSTSGYDRSPAIQQLGR